MGKRRQARIKTVLPVRVVGVDVAGKPFAELVHTLEISYSGARLGGVSAGLRVGEVVSVQCRLRKSQFTVAWVGSPESSQKGQVGLQNLEPQRDVFATSLKDQKIVDDWVELAGSGAPPDEPSFRPGRFGSSPPKPQPPAQPPTIAKRLEAVTAELEAVDKLMQSAVVNSEVLSHFREAVSRVRTTAWALQQWMDLEQGQKDPLAVLAYLNAERIAVAIRLCESLHHDLQRTDISQQKEQLQVLLGAVEQLFTRLAAMDLSVLDQEPEELKAKRPRSVERA